MGDAINFGPAWLRKVATFDSNAVSSIGGPPHSSSNNNNFSSSSSSSTSNNQTNSSNNNNNSSSSGSAGGGGSGSYSAALAAANATAAAQAAATASAAAASTTTRYALAEFRYGREEMLALFDVKAVKTPEILVNFKNLYVDKVQCPLALTPCTDDDVVPEPDTRRIWQTRSTSLGVPGRGARGGSVDRGRGRGRGLYLGYQRSTSFYDDESRSVGRGERPWLERNGTGGPLGGSGGTGGGEVDWNNSSSSPRKEFGVRARTANMESWRRARPDDEPSATDWRSGGLNTSGGSSGLSGSGLREKWSRSTSWRDEDSGTGDGLGRPGLGSLHPSTSSERIIPSSGAYKPRMSALSGPGGTGDLNTSGGTGPMSALRRNWDTEDQLPEWATENPSDYGGSFDASGAFHDSDNDVDGRFDDDGGRENHVNRKEGSSASSRRSASSKEGSASKEPTPNHLLEKAQPAEDSQKGKREEQKVLEQKEAVVSSKPKEDSASVKDMSSKDSVSPQPPSVEPLKTTYEMAAEIDIHKAAANSNSSTVEVSTKADESPSRGREMQSRDVPKKSASSSSVDRMQEVADDMVAQLIMDDDYTGTGDTDPTPVSRSLDKSPVLGAPIPINLLLSKEPVAMQQLFGSSSSSSGNRNMLLSDVNRSMLHGVGPQMPPIHHAGTDIWYYRDPQGKVQGPFPASEMTEWYRAGYFDDSLSVRRACDEIYTTLGQLVALCGGAIPFLNSMSIPPIKSSSITSKQQQQQQPQPQPPQAPTSSFQQQKPASTLQHLQQQAPPLDTDLTAQLQFTKKLHMLRQQSLIMQKLSSTEGWPLLSQEQQNAIIAQHMAQLQLNDSMLISPSLPTPTSSSNPPNPASIFGGVVPPQDSLVNLKQAQQQQQQQQQQQASTPPSAGAAAGGKYLGISGWNDSSPKIDAGFPDKQSNNDSTKLNRKESYKAQRKNYRREKKRVASELLNSLQDPAVIVLADWLKIRGTLKSWTKLWCVLKPGLLFIYKSPKTKSSHWVGTVLLTSCQVIERPSKKDGFCFKLFHPMDQTIWAPRGPDKETMGAVVQPLPTSYLIFRAPSQAAGKCWMDALELSLRCSALLVRSVPVIDTSTIEGATSTHETQWSEADYEKHFDEHDLDIDSQPDQGTLVMSAGESDSESDMGEGMEVEEFPETPYVHSPEEEFGAAGEQVEELPEEHKSLIWFLVKQVRPGMDLSKVVLPTFILEPRSFLDKLADSYYHADILSKAVMEDDPFTRMKTVVQWYLSGFYKKPKGLKKPYNPILGETFRCYWQHENGSRTFYIAEQVSHHPPISVFYVTNRQDGFCISCSILAKSKFYGNSTSAILEGVATLTLLPRGESYTLTVPYAHCKGILMGTLSMELGGKVSVECENTGYKTELEFKLKPFLGGNEYTNLITGKLKLGKETLATINGHWDGEIKIKDSRTNEESVLFNPTTDIRAKRLKRFTVPMESQGMTESERLWQHVTAAIRRDDQVGATEEKTALEEAQRISAKERKATCTEWIPALFQQDLVTGQYHYKYADLRPWDPRNDLRQYESNYRIQTKTRHQAPMVRTASVVSTEPLSILQAESRSSLRKGRMVVAGTVLKSRKISSNTSTPDLNDPNSDSSHSNDHDISISNTSKRRVMHTLDDINKKLEEHSKKLSKLQLDMDKIHWAPKTHAQGEGGILSPTSLRAIAFGVIGLLIQVLVAWFLTKRSLASGGGSAGGDSGSS